MITGSLVRNTRCMAAITAKPISANSGPRWSMVGMSMARSTRSGTLVGPGICRKCLPVCTVMGVLPGLVFGFCEPLEYHYSAGLSPARRGPPMHKKPELALRLARRQGAPGLTCRRTFRCGVAFVSFACALPETSSRPPRRRCDAARLRPTSPISTPVSAPSSVSSLHSPRWPMRNTLPATFDEARAERHVVVLEHDLAELIGVVPRRHQHGGQHRRILLRLLAQHFQPPVI